MMALLIDLFVLLMLVAGLFYLCAGAVGMLHLPDFFNRMHAASMCSTLGVTGLILALIVELGTNELTMRAVIAVSFLLLATPIGSHILCKAALRIGVPLWSQTLSDDSDPSKLD